MGPNLNYSKTRPWLKDRPSGAAWGRFGPAAWRAGLGLSGAGEGLRLHWDSTKLL